MNITHDAAAGTLESGDALVRVSPHTTLDVNVTTSVETQYGDAVRAVQEDAPEFGPRQERGPGRDGVLVEVGDLDPWRALHPRGERVGEVAGDVPDNGRQGSREHDHPRVDQGCGKRELRGDPSEERARRIHGRRLAPDGGTQRVPERVRSGHSNRGVRPAFGVRIN